MLEAGYWPLRPHLQASVPERLCAYGLLPFARREILFCGSEPVGGEFLLRPQLAFRIARDIVSASDTIADPLPWNPLFRWESVLSAQRERGVRFSSP